MLAGETAAEALTVYAVVAERREAAAKVRHLRKTALHHRAVVTERREAAAEVRHLRETATTKVRHLEVAEVRHFALAEARETTVAEPEAKRLLAQVVTRRRHVQRHVLYGHVLLRLDAPAAVTRGHNVQHTLARQQQLVLRPDGGRLVVGGVLTGRDGQRVHRALGRLHLHLLLILQTQRRTLLTRQLQSVERHLRLARRLQLQPSVGALTGQTQRQLARLHLALYRHLGAVDLDHHAVLHLLFHLRRSAVEAHADILCSSAAAHH